MTNAYSYQRWSTAAQRTGNSSLRQSEAIDKALREHPDWVLAEVMEADGTPSFRGQNMAPDTALGAWLAKLMAGDVPGGSVLIVEAMDRLTRTNISDALIAVLQILRAGCGIWVCRQSVLYTQQSIDANGFSIWQMLTALMLANDESRQKSDRLITAWRAKRRLAMAGVPMSAMLPRWLKLSADKKSIDVVEAEADLIRFLFVSYTNGYGCADIARYLNGTEHVIKWGQFNDSRIHQILRRKSVIGVLVRKYGKGEIEDYYPPIIESDLYWATITLMREKNKAPGSKGVSHSNLFGGLCYCAECGSVMRFSGDAYRRQSHRLCCRASVVKNGCSARGLRYLNFELEMLDYLFASSEYKWITKNTLVPAGADGPDLMVLKGRLADLERRLKNINDEIEENGPSDDLRERRFSREAEIKLVKNKIEVYTPPIEAPRFWTIGKNAYLDFLRDSENVDTRKKITQSLRALIKKISIDAEIKNEHRLIRIEGKEGWNEALLIQDDGLRKYNKKKVVELKID